MSSTNFGSILIFASCVVGTYNILLYVGEFFHNGRGHIVMLKNKHTYIRVYTYFIKNTSRTSALSSTNFRSLYANVRDGEYSETAYLLSKTVQSFTHETQVKRRAKEGGEVQATLRDMWAAKCFFLGQLHFGCLRSLFGVFCLSWVKSRLAKLSIICFVFASLFPLGRSDFLFFGVLSRFLLSALPTFY